mgnify:CR=1 FL=1
MRDYYRVYANIDLDAIYENVVNAKKLTKPGTKLMAIIKADAYGHGAVEVARTLDDVADAYGVAILEEGIELRQAGIDKPVLILGYTPKALYPAMIKHDIATAVFTWEMAQEISQTAEALGRTARIHIKLDTGMSRIGFKQDDESLETICRIAKLPNISIDGCFTHFARMDETDKTWALKQFERYQNFVKRLEEAGVTFPVKHVSNSAGIIEMPQVNLDMVRDGIAVYGSYTGIITFNRYIIPVGRERISGQSSVYVQTSFVISVRYKVQTARRYVAVSVRRTRVFRNEPVV